MPIALLGVFMQAMMPSLGDWLLLVSAWPLEQLVPLARRMAQGAEHSLFWQFSPGLTGVLLAIAGLSILVTRQTSRSLTIALVLSLPLLIPRGRSWQEGQYLAKLTVLDVGQGSAIVLQGPRQTLVYDTGGGDPAGTNMGTTVLLPYLRREGISSLDTLLVSHADNDHSAGAGALRSTLAVRQFLHSGVFPGSEGGLPCRAGQAWQWSSRIRFQILSPATGQALSSNNSSCVLQVQVGELRLLLPGDIDVKQEKAIVSYWRAKLRSDWLLAAHHGSNTSSSRLWLKYVLPAQVVFSAGYGNAFGHPHSSVVQRSREGSRSLYRTSTQGAMEFYLQADGGIKVLPYRVEQARYWH